MVNQLKYCSVCVVGRGGGGEVGGKREEIVNTINLSYYYIRIHLDCTKYEGNRLNRSSSYFF